MVVRPGRRPGSGGEGACVRRAAGPGAGEPRDTLLRAKDRSPPSIVRFGCRHPEFQRLEPFDRAMTLAAQAFTSIFPLVIATLSSCIPRGRGPARASRWRTRSAFRRAPARRWRAPCRRTRAGRDVRRPGPADRAAQRHQLLAGTDQDVREGLVGSLARLVAARGAGSPPFVAIAAAPWLMHDRCSVPATDSDAGGWRAALLLTFL